MSTDKKPLTPKQEKFCQVYIETGNASEAYRQSYSTNNMKPESVNRNAKALLDDNKISSRVNELRAEHAKRHTVTVDSLIAELEEARALGIKTSQVGAAVSASMGKAKLTGLDKQVIDHVSSDGSMKPTVIELVGVGVGDEKA